MSIAKPELRGLLQSRTKRHFVAACVFAGAVTLAWKFGVVERRKAKYAEFYKTYDVEKDYARMKATGVFQAVSSEGVVSEW